MVINYNNKKITVNVRPANGESIANYLQYEAIIENAETLRRVYTIISVVEVDDIKDETNDMRMVRQMNEALKSKLISQEDFDLVMKTGTVTPAKKIEKYNLKLKQFKSILDIDSVVNEEYKVLFEQETESSFYQNIPVSLVNEALNSFRLDAGDDIK